MSSTETSIRGIIALVTRAFHLFLDAGWIGCLVLVCLGTFIVSSLLTRVAYFNKPVS